MSEIRKFKCLTPACRYYTYTAHYAGTPPIDPTCSGCNVPHHEIPTVESFINTILGVSHDGQIT